MLELLHKESVETATANRYCCCISLACCKSHFDP